MLAVAAYDDEDDEDELSSLDLSAMFYGMQGCPALALALGATVTPATSASGHVSQPRVPPSRSPQAPRAPRPNSQRPFGPLFRHSPAPGS